MTIDSTVDQLRQRMIEDIVARKRGLACRKSHLRAYKRFAAWLQRSPDTATADEIRLFQVHLAETGVGICTRNNTMTGLNRRLVSADDGGIAFRWKDYRIAGPERWKTMALAPAEFILRFLIHVLPKGFHRIRHYGLFANTNRAESIARARELLGAKPRVVEPEEEEKAAAPDEPRVLPCPCPRCGGRMIVIEVFAKGA